MFDFVLVLGIFFLSPVKNDVRLFKLFEDVLEDDEDPAASSGFFGLFGHLQGGCLLHSQSHFFHLGKQSHKQWLHLRHFFGGGCSSEGV